MREEKSSAARLAAFNAVGLLGVPVQIGCLWLFRSAVHGHDLVATALAVELTVLHNFFWHIRWTWADRPAPAGDIVRRLVGFNLTNGLVSIAGNVWITAILIESTHVHYIVAGLVSIALCSLVNFVLSDRVVFVPAVRVRRVLSIACLGLIGLFTQNGVVYAKDLLPEASQAFDRYARLTEARMDQENRGELPFLWVDNQPGADGRGLRARVVRGDIAVGRLETRDGGRKIRFPAAICHHWVGTVFIPGVRLEQVATLMQSYNRYPEIYAPVVRRATVLSHAGDHFNVSLRLFQKKIVSVVLNTETDVTYLRVTASRMQVRSQSTRVAEVENPDTGQEQEKPIGRDSGFLWRFNNYCALDESGRGVFVQCESLSLSRDVPTGLGWLIEPFISGVPRDSLEFTLRALRSALVSD